MTDSKRKVFARFYVFIPPYLLWVTLCAALLGCGSTQQHAEKNEGEISFTREELQAYLDEAKKETAVKRRAMELTALQFLVDTKDYDWARSLSTTIVGSANEPRPFLRLRLLQGKLAYATGEPYVAKRYLFDPKIDLNQADLNPDIGREFYDTRATLLFQLGDFLAAFQERIALSRLLRDQPIEQQLNHDLLWEALAELPTEELYALAKDNRDAVAQGWFSLAALSKSNGANFRQQISEIRDWQVLWPEHPANAALPADLQLILQLADSQARKIAVMVPMSGKLAAAGKAVRDGLLSAYYDDGMHNQFVPELRFYDTASDSIGALFDRAVAEGAELVVGPLSKENVSVLAERGELPVPVLALNTATQDEAAALEDDPFDISMASTSTRQNPDNLFEFSLAIESEAKQVAERAWLDGHRRAMILAPAGAWGDRGAAAFMKQWQALGGEVLGDRRYQDQRDYSELVESAMAVEASKQRKREIQQIIGLNVEFEPRRRQDIDFIFLQAYTAQAQQIKPLLAFHYAGDLPVYSTSQVYGGNRRLSDLNGLKFTTMPWYFQDQLPERKAIQAYAAEETPLQSLYALGVDAYHIYPRLKQLQEISQAHFYGSTGRLNVNSKNVIVREQVWAEVVRGQAVPLKSIADADAETDTGHMEQTQP